MTDFTVISSYVNKERVEGLVSEFQKRGKSCYNFYTISADPNNSGISADKLMEHHKSIEGFYNDPRAQMVFKNDLKGLYDAETVVMLLPCGKSSHIEAGIAYGIGKRLVLIGEHESPDSLYFIFHERYRTVEEFLETIKIEEKNGLKSRFYIRRKPRTEAAAGEHFKHSSQRSSRRTGMNA